MDEHAAKGETTQQMDTIDAGEEVSAARFPLLTILTHPRFFRIGERFVWRGFQQGRPLALGRHEPDFTVPGASLGIPLEDAFISRKPTTLALAAGMLRIDPGQSSTKVVVNGLALEQAMDFPIAQLDEGLVIELSRRVALFLKMSRPWTPISGADSLGMVGHSREIEAVREEIRKAAAANLPVLIRGETGVGKELAARALHALSDRARKPFVCVNLAALPPALAAAELFGADRGAFTGAVQQIGYFRAAHKGVLFLDEVGEVAPEVQTLLLRVLETGEVYPVGRQTPLRVDVRIVAATDAALERAIEAGDFKAPLLHRLAAYELAIPPLRRRREDICRLFAFFATEEGAVPQTDAKAPPWLPTDLAAKLTRAAWPGNVRQCRNVARQLLIANRGRNRLQATAAVDAALCAPLPAALESAELQDPEAASQPRRKPLDIGFPELLDALRKADWRLKDAADLLHIARPSIYRLLDQYAGYCRVDDLTERDIAAAYDACRGDRQAAARRLMAPAEDLPPKPVGCDKDTEDANAAPR